MDDNESLYQSNFINGFSYPNLPIILDKNADIITSDYTWGLLPVWAKNEEFRKHILNAIYNSNLNLLDLDFGVMLMAQISLYHDSATISCQEKLN
ncbi:hypothetical protein AP058_00103 [Flavobacterium sp. TAB 87]|nr:hypothetical protein AP058_00103 [Flavobacterium sp. TAB 87]